MRTHELKTWPIYFAAVRDGSKTFEVRKNDRDFAVGDVLRLREWSPALVGGLYADDPNPSCTSGRYVVFHPRGYTGLTHEMRVTYVLHGGEFGIEAGFCVLGLAAQGEAVKP